MGWMMDATIHSFNVFNAYTVAGPMHLPTMWIVGSVSLRRGSTIFTKAGANSGCGTAYWAYLGIICSPVGCCHVQTIPGASLDV